MKRKIKWMLAFLLSLLLVLQLSVVSFAEAAEEADEDEYYEEEEDDYYEEDDYEDEEDDYEDEEDDYEEPYYVFYDLEDFSFEVDWDWEDELEELDYFERATFTANDGFSIRAALTISANEKSIIELFSEEFPDADPDDADYFQKVCCFLCGIDGSSGEETQTELIELSGYPELSDALFWYIYNDESFVKGGVYYADDYILIIAADCTDLTPAQDTALIHSLSTVEWYGYDYEYDYDDEDEEDFEDEEASEDDDDVADDEEVFEDDDDVDDAEEASADDDDEDDGLDDGKYIISGFSFEVSPDWEVEETELFEGCERVIFKVDDDFSIGVATLNKESADALYVYLLSEIPDMDFYGDDASHRMSSFLCGIDCPSGEKLRPSEMDLDDYYDLYSAVVWFIYDNESYTKGGAYSSDSAGILIAANFTELTPEYDAALTRVLATIDWTEEEQD